MANPTTSTVEEHGGVHRGVGEVRPGLVRVVSDEDVALVHVLQPDLTDSGRDGVRQGAHEVADPGSAAPQLTARRYYAGAEVVGGVQQRAACSLLDGDEHAVRRRRQSVADDLGGHLVDAHVYSFSRDSSPCSSTTADHVGGTKMVVFHSVTIAGPVMGTPGINFARS